MSSARREGRCKSPARQRKTSDIISLCHNIIATWDCLGSGDSQTPI